MKPYILDDASSLEYQRLDLMSSRQSWPFGVARSGPSPEARC
jgi:hypothetical protein